MTTPENPFSGGGTWNQLGSAIHPGRVVGDGSFAAWAPYHVFPALHGAYWNVDELSAGAAGAAVAATLWASPAIEDRHFSLWIDMPADAGSGLNGYELRFTETAPDTYDVTVFRWDGGTPILLASQTGHELPPGSSFALADEGGTVSAWTDTGGGFLQVLTAGDSTLDSGYVGLSGAGNLMRIGSFKAGALDGSGTPRQAAATLKGDYRLQGSRASDTPGAPTLTDIGRASAFTVETVDGAARQVLTFPQGGGLSLPTAGWVDPASHSVAMLFRLSSRTDFRRILDFRGGLSDNGLYNWDGYLVLYDWIGSSNAVLGGSYSHLVYTSSDAGGGWYDTAVYVDGVLATSGRVADGFGLQSGVLRFFKDDGTGEESGGAVACIQVYDGTLTANEVGQLAGRPSRCGQSTSSGAPGKPATPTAAPATRVRVVKRRRPRVKWWGGGVVVDTGLSVVCPEAMVPCKVRGRVELAPAFRWVRAGSVRLSVPSGKRRKVVVRLSPRGRRALRKADRVKVRAIVTARSSNGATARARQSGKIAFPARPRRAAR